MKISVTSLLTLLLKIRNPSSFRFLKQENLLVFGFCRRLAMLSVISSSEVRLGKQSEGENLLDGAPIFHFETCWMRAEIFHKTNYWGTGSSSISFEHTTDSTGCCTFATLIFIWLLKIKEKIYYQRLLRYSGRQPPRCRTADQYTEHVKQIFVPSGP